MPQIERLNDKSMTVRCDCGEAINAPYSDYTGEFKEEFGEYENFSAGPCPKCGMVHIFNMNLPVTEYEEQEIQELPYLPRGEKPLRDAVRDLMWNHRPDLKQKSRKEAVAAAKKKLEGLKKFKGKKAEEIVKELLPDYGKK